MRATAAEDTKIYHGTFPDLLRRAKISTRTGSMKMDSNPQPAPVNLNTSPTLGKKTANRTEHVNMMMV